MMETMIPVTKQESDHVIKQQQRTTARVGGLDSAVKPQSYNPMMVGYVPPGKGAV